MSTPRLRRLVDALVVVALVALVAYGLWKNPTAAAAQPEWSLRCVDGAGRVLLEIDQTGWLTARFEANLPAGRAVGTCRIGS